MAEAFLPRDFGFGYRQAVRVETLGFYGLRVSVRQVLGFCGLGAYRDQGL